MPAMVCDRRPCKVLQDAIKTFLKPDEKFDLFTSLTVPNAPGKPSLIIYHHYCFACGTRIDSEWVREARKRQPKRAR